MIKYLTVGTSEISRNLFINVTDNDDRIIKPTGGMWFTKYNPQIKNYCVWVDYIINNPNLLFYKNKSDNVWRQPCSIITLCDDAKIFNLDCNKAWQYLNECFPYNENKFSYQKLSNYYDGIFVDSNKLFDEKIDNQVFQMIRQFGVSSLILFNLECIDYYQSGVVNITPFDYEFHRYADASYEIEYDDVKKRILN